MSTQCNVEQIKSHLTTLQRFEQIPDYQHLGYTLKSLCNVLKTALLAQIEQPEYTEHDLWELYNLINLIQGFIPEQEMVLLDSLHHNSK